MCRPFFIPVTTFGASTGGSLGTSPDSNRESSPPTVGVQYLSMVSSLSSVRGLQVSAGTEVLVVLVPGSVTDVAK